MEKEKVYIEPPIYITAREAAAEIGGRWEKIYEGLLADEEKRIPKPPPKPSYD